MSPCYDIEMPELDGHFGRCSAFWPRSDDLIIIWLI